MVAIICGLGHGNGRLAATMPPLAKLAAAATAGSRSRTTTSWPSRARNQAVVIPARPAPMTRTFIDPIVPENPASRMRRMKLGVLMLDTRFPRLAGDVGNAASFSCAVEYAVVRHASVARLVAAEPDARLLGPFIDAGRELIARGCDRITTSCGFLVLWQAPLAQALAVPVLSSSLLLLPRLADAGVLTFDAAALGAAH